MKKNQNRFEAFGGHFEKCFKNAEIRYIFYMSTCPKLLNQFQPNYTQLFFSVLVIILSFNFFQNGCHFKMAAVQRGVP